MSVLVPFAIVATAFVALLIYRLVFRASLKSSGATTACATDSDCFNHGLCSADGTCTCAAPFTGPNCTDTSVPLATTSSVNCEQQAFPCVTGTDCNKCNSTSSSTLFSCQAVTAEQSAATGIAGDFCLPVKPNNFCASELAEVCDPSVSGTCARAPGTWFWEGWKNVEAQAWTCGCEYGNYYPINMNTGACEKSAELCRGGTWQYPCARTTATGAACHANTVSDRHLELLGADPATHGVCTCTDALCTRNADCVTECLKCRNRPCAHDGDCSQWCNGGTCVKGACVGTDLKMGTCVDQRTVLNGTLGIPTCGADLCKVQCTSTSCSTATDCANACQRGDAERGVPAPTCVRGLCTGKNLSDNGHWVPNTDVAPYVYGTCACPPGCTSTGAACIC